MEDKELQRAIDEALPFVLDVFKKAGLEDITLDYVIEFIKKEYKRKEVFTGLDK